MQAKTTQRKFPNPCAACKRRHLKCDLDYPACRKCRSRGSPCVRGLNVRFRHLSKPSAPLENDSKPSKFEFEFADNQTWVRINPSLSFLNETVNETPDALANAHDSTTGASDDDAHYESNIPLDAPLTLDQDVGSQNSSPGQISTSLIQETPCFEFERSDRTPTRSSQSTSEKDSPLLDSKTPFAVRVRAAITELGSPKPETTLPLEDNPGDFSVSIYVDTPTWPLKDPIEAMLFQTFVDKLAPLFDLCDSDRHFATVVPHRAVTCPPLMNAILAASARHLSRISTFDGLIGDQYHQNCLSVLIPALSSSITIKDENLLTAIVILRYMEELDVPVMSTSMASESHLVGTRVFVAAQDKLSELGSLRRAAFWVALRQEIHMAFMQARPVHANYDLETVCDLIVPDDNGCSFANLTIIHCAACLRYCFSGEEHNANTWEKLRMSQDCWWEERPWYFHPMYINAESNNVFPEVIFLNDAVVTGVLHYYLIEILLAAHNPTAPRLGLGQAASFRSINEAIKRNVRMVCGVAESNPRTMTSYAYVCLAITMGGDRFTDLREQNALYNILIKIDTRYAWPTGSTQEYLRSVWDWPETPNPSMSISRIMNGTSHALREQ
ncbi:hypothetical protein B0J13DRAFT_542737 [Dactylonectria estremocensis]|uniref:Zn(2)-C6 fungal-type domain-containing protein n=1 Tax=Dactylonectria estremocensis TaxID=1079267 RepID=A0A9P9J9X1_9HYPO|nr:hypothetical protein B0J13DRAFT_542737 [Dactylonectria estremocensis]